MSNTTIKTNNQSFSSTKEKTQNGETKSMESENRKSNNNQTPTTVEEFNKKISRTIFFKDRMILVNDALKAGKSETELELSVFEIELRAKEGNHKIIKLENGAFVKLFSWELIQRSIDKIKKLREQKAALVSQTEGVKQTEAQPVMA